MFVDFPASRFPLTGFAAAGFPFPGLRFVGAPGVPLVWDLGFSVAAAAVYVLLRGIEKDDAYSHQEATRIQASTYGPPKRSISETSEA